MTDKYILDTDGNPVPCEDLAKWSQWFQTTDRQVQKTDVFGHIVSTVFLGIDHAFLRDQPPLLYETMIAKLLPGGEDCTWLDYQERYHTRNEAIDGHTRAIDWLMSYLKAQG